MQPISDAEYVRVHKDAVRIACSILAERGPEGEHYRVEEDTRLLAADRVFQDLLDSEANEHIEAIDLSDIAMEGVDTVIRARLMASLARFEDDA